MYQWTDKRAGDRTRTGDVQLGKLAFYQLNYARSAGTNRRLKYTRAGTRLQADHPSPSLYGARDGTLRAGGNNTTRPPRPAHRSSDGVPVR